MSNNPVPRNAEDRPLLRVVNLRKSYVRRGRWARNVCEVEPLRGVDLTLQHGRGLALIGASGSGKSTLARCLAGLEKPDSGEIRWVGQNLEQYGCSSTFRDSARAQMVYQDPAWSLNPRLAASDIVSEPLLIARWGNRSERAERAANLMKMVGLSPDAGRRLPREFSGGQRRRLAIARALAVEPRLLILDEALAGLDLSTQAQIANLLLDLQAERALTYLWISHDLSLAARLAEQVAVMEQGRIVEAAPTAELFAHPQSRQARALLEATLALRGQA